MDAGLQGSLQLIAIANDLLGWVGAATAGVPINEETLALNVVEELGPDGDYLSHDHTYRHFKDAYYSKLADRQIYSAWQDAGSTTMAERAAIQVEEILTSHVAEAVPEDIRNALHEYVLTAEAKSAKN
jgi:trimethylamine--corrinoid protein Co-methyltransferase